MGIEKNGLYFKGAYIVINRMVNELEIRFPAFAEKDGEAVGKSFGMWFSDNPMLKRPSLSGETKAKLDEFMAALYNEVHLYEQKYKEVSPEQFKQFNTTNSGLIEGAFSDVLDEDQK